MEAVFYRAIGDARGQGKNYKQRAQKWLRGEGLNLATALGITPEIIMQWVKDGCPTYTRRKKRNYERL
jgi:hypothetical protein